MVSASATIASCTPRRSPLMPCRIAASSRAREPSSVSRHSMPSVMSSSRPAALMRGPSDEAEVRGIQLARIATGDVDQRGDARAGTAGADAAQPGFDEDAVVAVQRHQIRDGGQRDQIEQRCEIGRGLRARDRRRATPRARPAADKTSRRRRTSFCASSPGSQARVRTHFSKIPLNPSSGSRSRLHPAASRPANGDR